MQDSRAPVPPKIERGPRPAGAYRRLRQAHAGVFVLLAGLAAPAALPVVAAAEARKEPRNLVAAKLPKPIRTLHICAAAKDLVELRTERYGKSTLFFITCPPERGKLTPIVVYVARDAKGTRARRVVFETLDADGKSATSDVLYSAIAAREAYTGDGDPVPYRRVRNDPPWVSGAWNPDDRSGVCAVAAHWRLSGEKAELWFWEEAKECPAGSTPKYEVKLDKKPPPLVAP